MDILVSVLLCAGVVVGVLGAVLLVAGAVVGAGTSTDRFASGRVT